MSHDVHPVDQRLPTGQLAALGLQHVLVSTIEFGEAKIRGIFSAAEIGRQLGLEMDPMAPARSFAELEKVLLHTRAAA